MTGGEPLRLGAIPAIQKWMLIVLAVAVAAANIDQPYPRLAPLQHAPTLALILAALERGRFVPPIEHGELRVAA